jgi:tetrahydromethanopterin S-methyltransferase subunit C
MKQINQRIINSIISAGASFLCLFSIALCISGFFSEYFLPLLIGGLVHFIYISIIGGVIGCLIKAKKCIFPLMAGTITGLTGGGAMLLYAISQI